MSVSHTNQFCYLCESGALEKQLPSLHKLAPHVQRAAWHIHETHGGVLCTFTCAKDSELQSITLGDINRNNHQVVVFGDIICDPVFFDKLVSYRTYLDWWFGSNKSIRIDRSESGLTCLLDFDPRIITYLTTGNGLYKSDWDFLRVVTERR